ncbi:MAG: MATE family efflux transporter [Chloroflexi bacterium]|nr:MATE family efflux transporter [Chloroflexota bacterium]
MQRQSAEHTASPVAQTTAVTTEPQLDNIRIDAHGGSRGPVNLKGKDLTQGSIPKNLWWLAWPQIVESLLNTADQLVDIVWAGMISVSAIAGVGIAQTYRQLVMTGRMGLDTAMSAQVSRAIGARNDPLANHVALQGFTLSASFSTVVGLSGAMFTIPLMKLLGLGDDIIETASLYLRIQFLGVIALAFRQMSGAALQAAGNAVIPMAATTVTRITHIILTPFFIFGLFFFPELGIAGAALADVIAQFLGTSLNFWALFTGKSRLHLKLSAYRLDPPVLLRTLKIGGPAAISGMERSVAQLVIVGLVSAFGTVGLAAFSLTRRAENLAMLGAGGLARASGVLAGQNLGAGRPERARKTVYWALAFVIGLGALLTLLLVIFAPSVVLLFTRDADLVPVAVVWLRILALSIIFLGTGQVFAQSFNTAGDTMAPMIATLISMWFIEIPLAMVISGHQYTIGLFGFSYTMPVIADFGQYGIAWSITIAMFLRSVFFLPYLFWGPWLRKRVI